VNRSSLQHDGAIFSLGFSLERSKQNQQQANKKYLSSQNIIGLNLLPDQLLNATNYK
jgi:hypothetical protein